MKAISLALGASLTWGVSDFFGPLAARTLGALRVLVYVQLGGLVGIALVVAVRGRGPADPAAFLAIPAAVSGTLGLYAYYRGMATGTVVPSPTPMTTPRTVPDPEPARPAGRRSPAPAPDTQSATSGRTTRAPASHPAAPQPAFD